MPAEKTTGIVLRLVEFSETSLIVTMMTRDFGKITVMAKGARRPKGPFEAALDVLALCRIVFLHKTSGAMSLLTEAKLERRFRSGQTNLNRLYVGYYIVELMNSLTDEGDPHPELFDSANDLIQRIDLNEIEDEKLNLELLKFELRSLDLLGHKPMFTKCVGCGREKTQLTRVHFGLNAGGILCTACRRGKSNIVSLSSTGLEFLLQIVGGQIGTNQDNSDNWQQAQQVNESQNQIDWNSNQAESLKSATKSATVTEATGAEMLGEARKLINKYITHLLGYPPKLHKFLKTIS